jgi:hypothetical protein
MPVKGFSMKRFLLAVGLCGTLLLSNAFASAVHEKEEAPPPPKMADLTPNTGVEGRVVVSGQVLPGARVYAYATFADYLASKPFAVSEPTGDDGKYKIDLPRGSFYFVAKKRQGPGADGPIAIGDYFAFQGSNPISVNTGKYTHVGFSILPEQKGVVYEPSADPASGTLAGVILSGANPLSGVYVTLYMDPKEDFRGMTYATSPPTGKSGEFKFESLPETEYYVIARKRSTGKSAGPITDGDYFGFHSANPILIKAGQVARIELPVVSKAGEIGGEDSLFRDTGTRIRGRILDKEGKPAKGVYVFAYLEKVMAHNRPEFISQEVDKEGGYVLHLPKGGTYYIGARSDYGDTPALGEWYGRWEGTGDHSIKVETGATLEKIDMTVEKILP